MANWLYRWTPDAIKEQVLKVAQRMTVQGIGSYREPTKGWLDLIKGKKGSIPVTENNVYGLATVYRCVSLISQAVASMPIGKYYKNDSGRFPIMDDVVTLLKYSHNDIQTAFTFHELLIGSALLRGNGYAIIERNGYNTPIELIPVHDAMVEPFKYAGDIYYDIKIPGEENLIIPSRNMLHLRGYGNHDLKGISAISYFCRTLEIALNSDNYVDEFYKEGAKLDGILSVAGSIEETQKAKIRDAWNKNYGPGGEGRTAVLDEGTKYEHIGLTPVDSQLFETRKAQKNEIATWFGVPLHMVNEGAKESKGTSEQLAIEFLTYAVQPIVQKLEQEYWIKLLSKREKKNSTYWKYNTDGLVRADLKSRTEHFEKMLHFGVYSIDEVRGKLELNPIPNGNKHYVPLQNIDVDIATEFYNNQIEKTNE